MTTSYLDNYYARLGVPKEASFEEIRQAYYLAARRLHPDTNPKAGSTELFLQIQEAFEVLSDSEKRQDYDRSLPPDMETPADILVSAIYSRPLLPVMDEPQLVYVLLDMMAMPPSAQDDEQGHPPLNVALILDTSTSMKGARLDMVKSAAIELVNQLDPQDTLSIATFNDQAEVIVPAARGLDLKKVASRISTLQTRGGTEILKGLKAGLKEIGRKLSPAYVNHLILLTDGRTYGDEEECLRLGAKAAARGITISGIGIGDEWNDEFMDELTGRTGGDCVYAPRAKDIKKLLENKFQGLHKTFANRVSLEFTTGPEAELRYAFRLSPDASALSSTSPIHLGSLMLEPRLSVIMEFLIDSIPADTESICLADGTLTLDIPARAIPSSRTRISLTRPVGGEPSQEPPPQVLIQAMSRLSLYRLQEEARRELAAGDIDEATLRMHNLATQLLARGEPGLANTVLLEIENLEGGGEPSSQAEKRIKYGTRSLMLPAEGQETPT